MLFLHFVDGSKVDSQGVYPHESGDGNKSSPLIVVIVIPVNVN